jgi:hypothetical protein
MNVQDLVAELGLQVYSAGDMARSVSGGYASDLLSCVMARGRASNIWVTLQAHPNVVAVASLLDLAAVVVAEGIVPDWDTVERAENNGVALLGSSQTTFGVVAGLSALGVSEGT